MADLIVVYLSCGAPFGVLVFLSKHSRPTARTIAESILAAVFWPLLAISWTHRRLLVRHQDRRIDADSAAEISAFAHDPVFIEYETLTRAMNDAMTSPADPASELFELAGHSNPRLAAICAERTRNALLSRRQRASSAALIEHLRYGVANGSADLATIEEHCRKLGDRVTARSVEQIGLAIGAIDLVSAKTPTSESARLAA